MKTIVRGASPAEKPVSAVSAESVRKRVSPSPSSTIAACPVGVAPRRSCGSPVAVRLLPAPDWSSHSVTVSPFSPILMKLSTWNTSPSVTGSALASPTWIGRVDDRTGAASPSETVRNAP